MNHRQWSQTVSPDEASRRATGRAKYNKWQKDEAEQRLLSTAQLLCELGGHWGAQSEVALRLGVNRATISRYVAALRNHGWDEMDVEQRRKWVARRWAERNERRAREQSRWVKNGGPEAAIRRQQSYLEGPRPAARPIAAHETVSHRPAGYEQIEKQRRANNWMAQNMESLVARLLGRPRQ